MHRFFVSSLPDPGVKVDLPEEIAYQCQRVLKLRPAESIILFDRSGREAIVSLTEVTTESSAGIVSSHAYPDREPVRILDLWMGLARQEKWEWVLQKGTELGVSRFQPVETARSIARVSEADWPRKAARWGKIIQEAVEQSGRTRIPELCVPLSLSHMSRISSPGVVLHPANGLPGLREVLRQLGRGPKFSRIQVLIGPEGGLDNKEIDILVAAGWIPAGLGPRILRCETAAIAACTIILDAAGEMGTG